MKLIIGGAYQGKLIYAQSLDSRFQGDCWSDGGNDSIEVCLNKPILNHFHLLVLQLMESGESPEVFITHLLEMNPKVIIISNELGYGIVPLKPFERSYREMTGKLCCMLAGEAKEVHRVICGIGTKIKG